MNVSTLDLNRLDLDHPLRNTQLAKIQAQVRNGKSQVWVEITDGWGIGKLTYNQLGKNWTELYYFRALYDIDGKNS